ncbi:hypothetical protein HK097_009733 [Rhizophlyctis rosea]|uniref:ADP-ribosylglycohydrolase n=1 Tax=Rhizophlyctis rosea TaxID=64517 RepID=A0AAD5X448_9FUNG|nr:hypothetical protein HK097_009733 [Rhizophlyctis rosea]
MAASTDASQLEWTTLSRSVVADKVRGLLVGAALGDAIGLATEFLPRSEVLRIYGTDTPLFAFGTDASHPDAIPFHTDYHRAKWRTGDFTDDTDQHLLILLSFLRNKGRGIDPNDFASRLHSWIQQGLRCLDKMPCGIGRTTGNIVTDSNYQSDPIGTARAYWERTGRNVAPNGAVMRTAIIGALLAPQGLESVQKTTEAVASTTHADPRCILSCVIITSLVYEILKGTSITPAFMRSTIETLADKYLQPPDTDPSKIPSPKSELLQFCFPDSIQSLELDDRMGIGYTYRSLGSATWSLTQLLSTTLSPSHSPAKTFKSLITTLTTQGGDADTNATVAGALLGCQIGYSSLPSEWLFGLIHKDILLAKVDAALELMGVLEGEYDAEGDRDTLLDGGRGFLSKDEMERREMEMMGRMAGLMERKAKEGSKKEEGCAVM